MVSASEGWAVGGQPFSDYGGFILHYSEETWQQVPSPTDEWLEDIDMLSSEEGWAVSKGGVILHFTGGTWQIVSSPTTGTLNAIDMVSENEGWAVGWGNWLGDHEGITLHYSGGAWQIYSGSSTEDLSAIDMVSENEGWAVGWEGVIFYYCVLFGDLDCDGDVDVDDIMQVASRWRMTDDDPDWDARYDLDDDRIITVVDIMLVVAHWGEICG